MVRSINWEQGLGYGPLDPNNMGYLFDRTSTVSLDVRGPPEGFLVFHVDCYLEVAGEDYLPPYTYPTEP